jgi:hypothetical protein
MLKLWLSGWFGLNFQANSELPPTSSPISDMIQWLFVTTPYSKVVVGIVLYKFVAELDLCCHWKLRENRASNLSVSSSERNSPWYSATREIRSPAQLLSPPVTYRRDSCHCRRDLCSAGLDNAQGHTSIPAVDKLRPIKNSGRRTMFTAVELIWTPTAAAVRPCAACPNRATASAMTSSSLSVDRRNDRHGRSHLALAPVPSSTSDRHASHPIHRPPMKPPIN